jgi:CubicO group peptidase (beta-lactamase class C family)
LILASIIEQVSGLEFKNYLKKYIFEPIGMNSSAVYDRTNIEELSLPVQGYEGRIPWEDVYLNGCVGDKGVYSTTIDLLKFDRALNQNLLLSDSIKTLAFTKKNKNFRSNSNYGYGFRMKFSKKYGKIIYHTGWWKGFRSYFITVPQTDQTIVVLNNIKRGRFLNIEKLIDLIN